MKYLHEMDEVSPETDERCYSIGRCSEEVRAVLRDRSGKGWELVSVTEDASGGVVLYWKRPVEGVEKVTVPSKAP